MQVGVVVVVSVVISAIRIITNDGRVVRAVNVP